ncbi:hypothetical protein [Verrucomicrobium spinosum]|uniref:hypothetical protein n=1 Tax=Verrucomicrobium spinosum TaxID=2736 RepID=UPI0001745C1B|nr:hypothetical protein [Verrucomicrobium spinosum]
MIKSFIQTAALCLVASTLASCAAAQMPMRMLQAMGRTLKMADNQNAPAPTPIHLQQREIQDNRVPANLNPVLAKAPVESRVAGGAAKATTGNPS